MKEFIRNLVARIRLFAGSCWYVSGFFSMNLSFRDSFKCGSCHLWCLFIGALIPSTSFLFNQVVTPSRFVVGFQHDFLLVESCWIPLDVVASTCPKCFVVDISNFFWRQAWTIFLYTSTFIHISIPTTYCYQHSMKSQLFMAKWSFS